jgi:hypothetical protein
METPYWRIYRWFKTRETIKMLRRTPGMAHIVMSEEARQAVIKKFKLTEEQAKQVLVLGIGYKASDEGINAERTLSVTTTK